MQKHAIIITTVHNGKEVYARNELDVPISKRMYTVLLNRAELFEDIESAKLYAESNEIPNPTYYYVSVGTEYNPVKPSEKTD